MNKSPVVVLYDAAGNALAVQDGVTIPADTPGILVHAEDEDGVAHRLQATTGGGLQQVLYDVDGNPVDVGSQGSGQFRLAFVRDPEVLEILKDVLLELKRVNLYLSEMHETETDLEIE